MVVRVKVRVKTLRGEVVTSALANSGFETEEPEVVLPVRVAERLGIYPELPAGTEVDRYAGIGGVTVTTFRVREVLELTVLTDDRVGRAYGGLRTTKPGWLGEARLERSGRRAKSNVSRLKHLG